MIPQTLWESATKLQRYLVQSKFEFCFIGGIAYQRWGEPRVTNDLDLTLLAEFGEELPVIEKILERYQSRNPEPVSFALQARILLLQDLAGSNIDLAIGGMPYEKRIVKRASEWGTPGAGKITTCSAEDLVILKSFASRPRDWIDVENVVIRQANHLDRQLIYEELKPLVELKEEPEIMDQLEKLFDQNPNTEN